MSERQDITPYLDHLMFHSLVAPFQFKPYEEIIMNAIYNQNKKNKQIKKQYNQCKFHNCKKNKESSELYCFKHIHIVYGQGKQRLNTEIIV